MPPGPPSLSIDDPELLARFEEFLRTPGLSGVSNPKTIHNYLTVVKELVIYARGREITPELVRDFILDRYGQRSPKTIKNVKCALIKFLRDFLGRADLVSLIPIKASDERPERETPCPKDEDLRKFIMAAKSKRDRALIIFMASTGLRLSEVAEIRLKHLDLKERCVRFHSFRKKKNTGVIIFSHEAKRALEDYLAEAKTLGPDDRLFGLTAKGIARVFERLSKRAGVKITPQMLRVWHSVKLRERGVDSTFVNILEGRADPAVITNYYTPKNLALLREIYDKADLRVLS